MVAGCFIAGSAQLLEPHHIHHIPQTDGAGSSARGAGGGAGWLELMETGMFFVCACANINSYRIQRMLPTLSDRIVPLHTTLQRHVPTNLSTDALCMRHVNMSTHTVTVCSHTHTHSIHFRLANTQGGCYEPEWPIFSLLSLMRAIKSTRHQYFSFLIRQAVIFLFDEAHERCFVFARLPFLSHVIQDTRDLDRRDAGYLDGCQMAVSGWNHSPKALF